MLPIRPPPIRDEWKPFHPVFYYVALVVVLTIIAVVAVVLT